MTGTEIVVRKCNLRGQETWRYSGRILERGRRSVLLEARFNRPDLPFHGVLLRENDRFVEWYSSESWYNLFEVHDRDDDKVKCWYCNITMPAEFIDGTISYVDLALDLLVFPDGRMLVLDEDEFAELELDETTRAKARQGMAELKRIFEENEIVSFGLQILMA